MFRVFLTKEAAKFYQKADKTTKDRLDECFETLKVNPMDGSNIKRLHGELEGLYRYRMGQLRVVLRSRKTGSLSSSLLEQEAGFTGLFRRLPSLAAFKIEPPYIV